MNATTILIYSGLGLIGVTALFTSLKIVRQFERGLIERFGKYKRIANPGLNVLIPFGIEKVYRVNITEMMVDADKQEIITKDKLNAMVDAQVYFKVRSDEESIKNSQYNVYNYENQIVQLARTTLRNIIGTMLLNEANSERGKINDQLMNTLQKETKNWGIDVVRTELKEINPPKNVQETMNSVVVAENQKQAAIDFATASETRADGERRATIKSAEGQKQMLIEVAEGEKQATIKKAEGQQKAFELINKSFIGNAQLLRQLEVAENVLKNNTKVIVPEGSNLINVISDSTGVKIIPVEIKTENNKGDKDGMQ